MKRLAILTAGIVYCASSYAVEPVWPGTPTRYYPGIYPLYASSGVGTLTSAGVQSFWNSWFAGRESDYKETYNSRYVTHLGVQVLIDPALFFSDHWRNAASAPYDWKGTCGRVAAAQNPGVTVGGYALYNWAWWDSLLATPFVAQGKGKLVVRIMETYTGGGTNRTPLWMRNEGYVAPGAGNSQNYCQMQDAAVVYMWQDMMTAFATKYKGDPRIAALLIDEVFPSLWQETALCGNAHGLSSSKAANAGLMDIMKAYLDVDSGMLWTPVNWYSSQTPVVSTWENGYGGNTVGAKSLPGVQGHYRQDMKFFQSNLGSGASCTVDGDSASVYSNSYLIQYYGVKNLAPVFVASEANGWTVAASTGRRAGNANPWNVNAWPAAGGILQNDSGDIFPSAHFWAWYCSGSPKVSGAAADSKLGQAGTDPCGVLPANFFCMQVPNWNAGKPGWTAANLSIEKWLAAFRTFGPKGTQALFNHPAGYLQQFTGTGMDRAVAAPAGGPEILVSPNPWRGGDVILRTPSGAGVIRILDLRGRDVARFKSGGTVRWNGKDGSGKALAPGVYTAVVRAQNKVKSARFIRVK